VPITVYGVGTAAALVIVACAWRFRRLVIAAGI
jgi:hypothetical protein